MNTEIVAAPQWDGFTFVFSNGWSVSIQQSKAHHCTEGKSVEVAILDPDDRWYRYCELSCDIYASKEETYVNGWLNADHLGRVISIVSQNDISKIKFEERG